jgi:hypothetical protein
VDDSLLGERTTAALWSDRLWPMLAGVLTASGVIGVVRDYGLPGMVLLPLVMWLLVSLMVWGAFSETGVIGGRALRYGGIAAHSFVTAIGVLILFPVTGWAAVAVWGLTSPPVTGWLGRRTARRAAAVEPGGTSVRGDQARVDRAFTQIVRGFHESA